MIGAFKTPRLRNISASAPYMHNGAYATLEDTVRQIVRLSVEAQAGSHPNIAEEYRAIKLTEEHVAPLVAFLEALRDQGKKGFREMMLDIAPLDYDELQSL
jgi:cytochrome c peroxidase